MEGEMAGPAFGNSETTTLMAFSQSGNFQEIPNGQL